MGDSIVVKIPKKVARQEGIRADELLEIDVKKAREDRFGAFKGMVPYTRKDELHAHD